ncbi:hypothetical protein DBR06_SOUSAS2910021, partial [Sousa chinensis]
MPNLFVSGSASIMINGKSLYLGLWATAGQED